MKIEWLGLTVDTNHPFAGDLEINLISPMGTKINIISPNETRFAGYDGGFRFSSVGYIDENSQGKWQVEITDRLADDEGVLKSLTLEVYGHED
jgi:subtilisin-like proprotein convertase family protein